MNKEQIELYFTYTKLGLTFVLVIAFGLFAINQAFQYYYTANLLKQPCEVCKVANEPQADCIDYCFTDNHNLPYNKEEVKDNVLPLSLNFTYP